METMAMARRLGCPLPSARPWCTGRFCHGARALQTPDLRQWVEKHGGYVSPGIELSQDGQSGLGLLASQWIPRGQTLIRLPSRLQLGMRSGDANCPADETLQTIANRVPEELWSLKLGLKLLNEKAKENSFWWPYISLLPQRFQTPIFFSGEEIASLQYPPLIHQVKKRCQVLYQISSKDIPAVLETCPAEKHPFGGQQVDGGALGWAMSAVSSRAFRLQNSAGDSERVLLPLIDMCNHSFSPNSRLEQIPTPDNTDFLFQVVAESSLEKGMPLSLTYGALSNDYLLLDYGFVVSENPHDRVELKYDPSLLDVARMAGGLSSQGPQSFTSPAPWQQALLAQLRLQGAGASLMVTLGGPDIVEGRLLAALRILYAADVSELRHQDLEQLQQWGSKPPLGFANERNVLRTLAALSALVLTRSFATTVEQDRASLGTLEHSSNQQLTMGYRLEKKQMLLDTVEKVMDRLNSLKPDSKVGQEVKARKGKGFG
ncbi:hypothetical protein MPTK1_8g14370 [Marchantia polymorpha subsp. ruderalis]|uniref:SET domain-containing protein n=2 Tax=Marchantia polymorpha TaxID=3197 RepID=A0A176W8Z6_MARPO|nr:hypothetical protein AXG93_2255s1040 [Marchantia polymorpha subsp. ruderalis]PTQ31719.1 hypothetical protein MARPO_0108s0064 [Marchantia polymorpha]BBN19866.1 hypothetical protein Mp_8g14370 [Marchantia polymorpha subsp. ruderalis]|eukprot:PTQ31719.1 hypothetical protein MARPO_0108s0064 [Marchantia polymorpha]